jgi:hypothetical protein
MTCSTLSWLAGGVSVALGEGLPDVKCAALVTGALDKLTASVDAFLWLFRQVRCSMSFLLRYDLRSGTAWRARAARLGGLRTEEGHLWA